MNNFLFTFLVYRFLLAEEEFWEQYYVATRFATSDSKFKYL